MHINFDETEFTGRPWREIAEFHWGRLDRSRARFTWTYFASQVWARDKHDSFAFPTARNQLRFKRWQAGKKGKSANPSPKDRGILKSGKVGKTDSENVQCQQ